MSKRKTPKVRPPKAKLTPKDFETINPELCPEHLTMMFEAIGKTPAPAGLRYNSDKEPWHLLPFDALQQVVRVLQFGAQKYEPRNWEKGLSWAETLGSMWRHAYAMMRGELLDPESGLPHAAHLTCNGLFITAFILRGVGKDDRPLVDQSSAAHEIEASYQTRSWKV